MHGETMKDKEHC